MDEAKLQEIEARATAIHAEMTHTRARCDDCGAVNPRLDDRGLHDGCPAGDWPRPPMRDWTKLEGVAGLCEIAGHMTALVAEVRRLTAALDAARREGAEGMQQRCEETCASIASAHAERFVLKTAGGAIYAAREYGAAKCGAECVDAIRALPLDAPGGGS